MAWRKLVPALFDLSQDRSMRLSRGRRLVARFSNRDVCGFKIVRGQLALAGRGLLSPHGQTPHPAGLVNCHPIPATER